MKRLDPIWPEDSPGLVLCTCGHELRQHWVDGHRRVTVCQVLQPGVQILSQRARQCPCVRYREAGFGVQQIPLVL